MKKIIIIIFIFALIVIGGINIIPEYLSNTKNEKEVEFKINKGDNLTTVSKKLYDKGIIRSKYWFKYNGQDVASKLKPGNYTIPADTDIGEIYDIIQKGEQKESVAITFPEGFLLYEFAERIEEEGIATKEEFIDATDRYFEGNSYEFDNSNHYFNMEGYLFPDTYYFEKDQTIDEIVEILVSTMDRVFTEEDLKHMEKKNLSKHEILTIASLIEREAYNGEEKQSISGVIYNRLDIDMPLQIDATVIYGKGEGKEHTTRVLYADLKEDNPYNTYKNKELVPGPIASPGKESIYAALYPEENEYLFYVLGEEGHVFSKDYEEHKKHEKAYKDSLKKNN